MDLLREKVKYDFQFCFGFIYLLLSHTLHSVTNVKKTKTSKQTRNKNDIDADLLKWSVCRVKWHRTHLLPGTHLGNLSGCTRKTCSFLLNCIAQILSGASQHHIGARKSLTAKESSKRKTTTMYDVQA